MTEKTSNPNFDKEQAEGSRETVEQSMDQDQQGITNKSAADEQAEQAKLPPRGEAKKD
jgi:hypothetical protein